MLVLEYVNVKEDHAVLEARNLQTNASIDVLVGKTSAIIGKVMDASGDVKMVSGDECAKVVGIMRPPKAVMHVKRIMDSNAGGTIRYIRMPGLFNWLMLTYGMGVHEMTTEYETAYG